MPKKYSYKKQITIFFFLILAIAGPPILSTIYGKVHKYVTEGRWDDYSYMEIVGEDGKKKTVKVPIMIDDWGPPNPWEIIPHIIIFILCPVIGIIGIWKLTSRY
jgi:hypothetical protein